MSQADLKPCRSTAEAKERGKKGGIASGKARNEKKTLKKTLNALLNMKNLTADGVKIDGYTELGLALMSRAKIGDVQAFIAIRDTIGEKPTNSVDFGGNIEVVFNIPRPDREKK